MKTKALLTTTIVFIIFQVFSYGQEWKKQSGHNIEFGNRTGITLIDYEEDFDGDSLVFDPNCILVIDTTLPGNIWQIGQPQKALFDSAYSAPNALVTDLIYPYPPNNYSTVEFALKKPDWATFNCWSFMYLAFSYRMETDTLHDGYFIEMSYDGGITWNNIKTDTMPSYIGGAYQLSDTLYNGEPGLSGTSHAWLYDSIPWTSGGFSLSFDPNNQYLIDSCRIRITFISDGVETSKDGILIDNVRIEVVDFCDIGIGEIDKEDFIVEIYPNPITENSVIYIPGLLEENEIRLEIVDLLRNMVFKKNTETNPIPLNDIMLPNGLYLIRVAVGNELFVTKRILINN